jgi:hypothetical protein
MFSHVPLPTGWKRKDRKKQNEKWKFQRASAEVINLLHVYGTLCRHSGWGPSPDEIGRRPQAGPNSCISKQIHDWLTSSAKFTTNEF